MFFNVSNIFVTGFVLASSDPHAVGVAGSWYRYVRVL